MTYICDRCYSTKVEQQYTIMVDANAELGDIDLSNLQEDNYFFCLDCGDETGIITQEEHLYRQKMQKLQAAKEKGLPILDI